MKVKLKISENIISNQAAHALRDLKKFINDPHISSTVKSDTLEAIYVLLEKVK